MSRILLGVTGGIAAYKACELVRRLRAEGHDVTVVPTAAALEFVGATTWAALSGHPVHTSVFDDAYEVPHVRLGQEADLVLVAPATADLLARAATGRADDLLTNVLLTARCPILFAPAMHTEMWLHPATKGNVDDPPRRGAVVIDPDSGRLTGADSGPGRLPDPAELAAVATAVLADPGHRRPGGAAGPGRAPGRGQRRRNPGASGSGPLRRQPLVGPDGLGAGPRRGAARGRGAPRRGQRRVARTAGRRDRDGGLDGRPGRRHDHGGEDRRPDRDGRGGRRLHARRR